MLLATATLSNGVTRTGSEIRNVRKVTDAITANQRMRAKADADHGVADAVESPIGPDNFMVWQVQHLLRGCVPCRRESFGGDGVWHLRKQVVHKPTVLRQLARFARNFLRAT